MANASVKIRKNEDIYRAIKRFKRQIEASGVMKELKRRRYYHKPSEAKKLKRANAAKKRRKTEKRKSSRK